MARYLTKSRFKMAVECPRKLFYEGKSELYRDTRQGNSFLQALADGGFQVGELAKHLYPGGIEIKARGNEEALADTAELLKRDTVTLFEPAIGFGRLLVRVDVLVKNGNSIKIVEVKAKSIRSDDLQIEGKKGLKSKFRPYIEDIAFQKFVVQSALPECRVTSYLLMPDKAQVAAFDRMNQLFKIERRGGQSLVKTDDRVSEVTAENSLLYEFNVDHYIALVENHGLKFPGGTGGMRVIAALWAEAYAADRALPPSIGAHCMNCEFRANRGDTLRSGFHECWKEANGWTDDQVYEPTLLELWNFRGKQKLMDTGARRLSDVTQEDLHYTEDEIGLSTSVRQWLQVDGLPSEAKSVGFMIDRPYLAKQMRSWRFPLHFIDFETSTVALPFHVGMRPYESVAFQFSHHVIEGDGSLRHADQFLMAKPGVFPNYNFVRALKQALERDNGSVFMWASHENTILSHIREQIRTRSDAPEDKAELISFIDTLTKGGKRQLVDLRIVALKGYFHPATKGSNSIKAVLPAVLASTPLLRERYSQPIYGSENGIPSLNFRQMIWWTENEVGSVEDPYKKLKEPLVFSDSDDIDVAEGGEASMAYCRLQYETLSAETRVNLEERLLRYCELDTLAMAMIVQAWEYEITKP